MDEYSFLALTCIAATNLTMCGYIAIQMYYDNKTKKRLKKIEERLNNVDKAQTD